MRTLGGQLGPGESIRRTSGATPSADWQNLRLTDFVQFNAATFLDVGGVVDNGGALGWSIPLLGGAGKSVADPFDGWHAITANPITDAYGLPLAQAREWAAWLALREISGIAASADIDVVVGLCNGPTDGASNDWIGCGFRWGATRTGLTVQGTNGTATLTAGTSLATIRRLRFPVIKVGTVTSALVRPVVQYQDNNNATLNAANAGATSGTSYQAGGAFDAWADAPPHLFVAAYRTSTTDTTTRTPCFQPARAAALSLIPPA